MLDGHMECVILTAIHSKNA